VVYVSALTPTEEQSHGALSKPWPWRKDRNVSGGPMVIDGRSFSRGIGVRSRTALSYALDTTFEQFAATIGIDDSVRPRGSVMFLVLGDDRILFESGEVTGRDTARDVLVDLSGVKKLTLSVEFGDDLDLSDHADWGGARLVRGGGKKPGKGESGS
jgi:hypothetical protein